MKRLAHRLPVVLLLASLGCAGPSSRTESAPQAYRAYVVSGSGEEIPFLLELPANCNTHSAAIVNGAERIPVLCQRFGNRLLLDFPVYGTRISAEVADGGGLAGEWSHSVGALRDRLRFGARPLATLDPAERFPRSAVKTTESKKGGGDDPSGTWRMTFATHGSAKGVFTQVAPGIVHGTAEIVSEYGDLRFMAGNIHGADMWLSAFDGAQAYVLRGRLGADGTLQGEIISGGGVHDMFVAERSRDFDVSNPLQQVRVVSTNRRIDFAPLRMPRYAGKAVILELFGTWCSTCNDLAVLLAELHREHRDEGLEIVSLAYEASADKAYTRARLNAYRAKHGLAWETILADGPANDLLGPAELSPMDGVPVTLFLNRDRTISAIYTGFWGPATGATHRKAVDTFRRLTREILASVSAPPLPSSPRRAP